MEKELEAVAQDFLGNYGWMLIVGIAVFTFRSAIEGIVEGLKVFLGNDLNTDDVVTIDDRPARIVRVGIFKTIFFVYNIGCVKGKPYIKGGSKMAIQNDKLKEHSIEKPLPMLDLTKWEEECEREGEK
tara:strand:+ start:7290 stop:7673 length:384 start_codon:yes stop_codon:yes gene_type:complete